MEIGNQIAINLCYNGQKRCYSRGNQRSLRAHCRSCLLQAKRWAKQRNQNCWIQIEKDNKHSNGRIEELQRWRNEKRILHVVNQKVDYDIIWATQTHPNGAGNAKACS